MGAAPGSIVQNNYKVREGGGTMKALTWQGPDSVKVMEVGIPTITQPNDVVLKVTGSTICGSDLHLYHGEIVALQKGDILGHEFMGVVDEVGPGVKKLQKGDVSGTRGCLRARGGIINDSLHCSAWSCPSRSPAESAGTASRSFRPCASAPMTRRSWAPCTLAR